MRDKTYGMTEKLSKKLLLHCMLTISKLIDEYFLIKISLDLGDVVVVSSCFTLVRLFCLLCLH